MNKLTILALLLVAQMAEARTVIQQNLPGTNWKDYTAPATVFDDDGQVYQTLPGGLGKDFTAPAYYRDGNTYYREVIPSIRARDFTEPSYSIEDEPGDDY